MRTVCLALLGLMLAVSMAAGQGLIPEQLLITTGHYLGPGARAGGLAGTYTAIADDYSSIWWNPAGLTQVKRIELQGSLARTGYGAESTFPAGTDEGNTSNLRLNNLGIVFPVPVYQGALSFAFGYNQVAAFERRLVVSNTDGLGSGLDEFDVLESGRLGMWSLAGAVDVSPNLALGLGLNYVTGFDSYTETGAYQDFDGDHRYEFSVDTDLGAWGANVGGLFRMGRFARLGVMFQTPMSMLFEEEWTETDEGLDPPADDGFFDYRMTYPAVVRAGLSFAPGRWLVAADVEYRDWTSLEFRTDTPFEGVSKATANQEIKDTYRGTTRYSVGGEYLFPLYGIRARAGYAFEPSAYKLGGDEDNRHVFAGGLGVLVDRSVLLDLAMRFSSYTEKSPSLTQDINVNSALITVSYRM